MGLLGYLGIAAMVISDVIASTIRQDYNPISKEISFLAIHNFNPTQDIGLYLLGLGTLACAAGLYVMLGNGLKRRVLVVLLFIAGLDIFLLTAFAVVVGDMPYAFLLHEIATGVLFAIFVLVSFLFGYAVRKDGSTYASSSYVICGVFIAMLAGYAFVPQGWKGIYERVLVLDALVWLGMVSYILVRRDDRIV